MVLMRRNLQCTLPDARAVPAQLGGRLGQLHAPPLHSQWDTALDTQLRTSGSNVTQGQLAARDEHFNSHFSSTLR